MEEVSNLFHLLRNDSPFKSVLYGLESKENLNSEQFHFQVEYVTQALKCISANQTLIGCILKPCISLPAILFGILKVSSSFAFLDVRKPLVQLRNLQKYIALRTLLVDEAILKNIREELCKCWVSRKELCLEGCVLLQSHECSNEECPNSLNPKDPPNPGLAYVVQTSGTTGDPKVVQVPHQCILPNIIDFRSRFDVTCSDVILLCSPLTFDPSVIDIFLAVSSGSTLVMVPDQIKSIPKRLKAVIEESKVTILQCTPSLFRSLGEAFIRHHLLSADSCLRVLALGGEPCPSLPQLQQWRSEWNKTRVFNLYGLTEVSCWASAHLIHFDEGTSSSNVPLGEPLLDTVIEVRNQEVYVGGNQRWCVVDNEAWPDRDAHVLRPTGDLVRQTPAGELLFTGRRDDVVKYKGRKLPLQRIHEVLEGVSGISEHFVYFDAESSNLLLFIVQGVSSDTGLEERVKRELRDLVSNLPVTRVISVPAIPLTVHGKSDRRKLVNFAKEQLQLEGTDDSLFSKSSCEEMLLSLWMNYTNQTNVPKDANFVLQGGDSVSALLLASDVERRLRVRIPELVDALLNSTLQEVEELLRSYQTEKNGKRGRELLQENTKKRRLGDYNLTDFKCHEVSSRRGRLLRCLHRSGEGTCRAREGDPSREGHRPSLTEVTKFDLEKCVDASPTISYSFQSKELLVFIGSHSGLLGCISIGNPDFKWIVRLPDRIESSSCLSSCGNCVVVGCYDYHVYGVCARNGTILWKFKTGAEVKSSPVVSTQNIAYVGSHDKQLYAIKAQNGELLWKKVIGRGSIFSSPALSEELCAVAVATLDGVLSLLNMDCGDTLWSYHHGRALFSSPLFTSTGVFVGSTDNCLLQCDLSGSVVLEYKTTSPVFSSPRLGLESDHVLFGCHDCNVHCMDSEGRRVWTHRCDSPVYATPFTFRMGEQQCMAVASTQGTVYVLEEATGEVVCSHRCPGEIFSSPVVLDGFLVVGCRDNFVYIFKL